MDIILSISELINTTDLIIEYFRVQDFFQGNKYINLFISKINCFLNDNKNLLSEDEMSDIIKSLGDIMEAQKNEDYILIADLFEMSILSTLQNVLTDIIVSNDILSSTDYLSVNLCALRQKKTADSVNYSILADKILKCSQHINNNLYNTECTNSGYPTLKYISPESSYYYHSNISPVSEAKKFARYYSRENCYNYTILGFGMGYHIREFLNYDRRFTVHAIETNINVLTLAFIYCDLRDIISCDRLELILCNEEEITGKISSDDSTTFIIHYPSLRTLKNDVIRNHLHKYFINTSSMYSQKKYLDWNFYYNIKLCDKPAQNIMPRFKNKSVIYIAGGPSLEYYLKYLSDNKTSNIIICASTVYRKLLQNSITPDYVIMIDAQDNMINHFNNIPVSKTSLIYLSSACHKAVAAFQGERYILFQNGYDKAEEYAGNHGISLIETGGSVSTTVTDYLIKCGCSRIINVGLDLAYTDNKSHSFGIGKATCSDKMFMVKSVSGGTVPTTNVLNIYRLWIEERIKNVTDIKFINLSHGAYINGMDNCENIT